MNFYGRELSVFKANLHTHSKNSDGGFTPEELICLYAGEKYDVLAFTDHRKTNKVASYDGKGMTLLSGIELHPAGPREILWHLLALNVPEDFPGTFEKAQDAIDAVNAAGGIVFCAHPHWCGLTSADVLTLHGLCGIEVSNTSCRFIGKENNEQCWDELISAGFVKGALAVDDTHGSHDLFRNWTMICAENNSTAALLDALKNGFYYASQGPVFHRLEWNGNVLEAEFSEADEVVLIGKNSKGICITAPDHPLHGDRISVTSFKKELPENYGPVRCRIRDKEGNYAWSAPLIIA